MAVNAVDKVRARVVMQQTENARVWMVQSDAYRDMGDVKSFPMLMQKTDSLRKLAINTLMNSAQSFDEDNHAWNTIPNIDFYIIVVTVVLLLMVWYQNKAEQKNEAVRKRAEHDSAIRELTEIIRKSEVVNQNLQKVIRDNQQMMAEHIGRGYEIYENVRGGGLMNNISIEDERCFVDYYAFAFPTVYHQLLQPYMPLSLRHTTYLILCSMQFTSAQIERILFIQPSTLRNYRLRIKQRKRDDR